MFSNYISSVLSNRYTGGTCKRSGGVISRHVIKRPEKVIPHHKMCIWWNCYVSFFPSSFPKTIRSKSEMVILAGMSWDVDDFPLGEPALSHDINRPISKQHPTQS